MLSNLKLIFTLYLILFFPLTTFAQDLFSEIDESTLFADEQLTVQVSATANSDTILTEQKSVNFTGQLQFDSAYYLNKKDNQLLVTTDGDLFLDVRLKKGIKAFMDVNVINLANPEVVSSENTLSTLVDIKELFVDFNIDKKVYFRAGKQFLKWGTTYFWNPVDFVNIDQKQFLALDAIRSGIYGFRAHIPQGINNLYFFINSQDTQHLSQLALVTKYEFTVNNTEIGLSMYNKKDEVSLFGLDYSTNLFGLNWKNEIALTEKQRLNTALNLGKSFNWERPDRINASYEIAYTDDLVEDYLHQAFFITISEFPSYSTELQINGLQNLDDYSGILSTQLTYTILDEFKINLLTAMFFGDEDTQYLENDNRYLLQLSSTLQF